MDRQKRQLKVMFSGGGTGGSVTPLLVVARKLRQFDNSIDLMFIGTSNGPEKKLVLDYNLPGKPVVFKTIPAGKWRRYLSIKNLIDIFNIIIAFFVSICLLRREKPSVVVSAGGFVSVPLAWAAYILNIPVIIHQQDVRPGLANRLMAKTAKIITVSFEKSLKDYGKKARWIGNPAPDMPSSDKLLEVKKKYRLSENKPILMITGGGTGSEMINRLTWEKAEELVAYFQVFHLTGKGKAPSGDVRVRVNSLKDYHWQEIVNSQDALCLLAAASLVVSRCGLATLTEMCALRKSAILIPIPSSHQEDNAQVFSDNQAAIVLEQNNLTSQKFKDEIMSLFSDQKKMLELSTNIDKIMRKEAASKMVEIIKSLLK